MPRGDESNEELLFSDRDDDSDEPGYGGGSSYDDDEDEEGSGWGMTKHDGDDLWDSAEDEDDDLDEDDEGRVGR